LVEPVSRDGETLYYCVPANAINQETDADYHQKVVESIFKSYESETGYKVTPKPINEALAVVYAELGAKAFTGVGISCLVPGTKIYTDKGIVDIENVKIGDEVLTHKGRWRTVNDTVESFHSGKMVKVTISGVSGNDLEYKFVDNHKLYVYRDNQWQWIGCDNIIEGDIVGEPIENFNENANRTAISIPFRNTSSKVWTVKDYPISEELCELIGYFLGDGSVSKAEGAVNLDFANHEQDNINNVINLFKLVFDKDAKATRKSDNCTRVKCYSKPLVKWFAENCYSSKQKKCPFDISQLTDNECKALLAGLINSDGMISENSINFYNSTSNLVALCKRLFSRIGVAATIDSRAPRTHFSKQRGLITAKKTQYRVTTGQQKSFNIMEEVLGYKRTKKTRDGNKFYKVENGFLMTKVKKIEIGEYTGLVYDLRVTEDHSFSGPNLTIKNCGAGQVNVCYAMYGNPIFQFSLVNSGDWIDKQAAKATGESPTFINKEKMKVDLRKDPETLIERAIITQYRLMIEKTIQGIKEGLASAKQAVKSEHPVDFVVAGGTSMATGFVDIFAETLKQANLTIKVGDVIRPQEPLYSVAKGCLIAAEAADVSQ
jgi:intein/homing endonuclease